MGRPPSNGGPSFRFNPAEVTEMEAILQAHNIAMPSREVLEALANKFSSSADRSGKVTVQNKQVWNWFQNRRYAIRAKAGKSPGKWSFSPVPQSDSATVRVPAKLSASHSPLSDPAAARIVPQAPQSIPSHQVAVKTTSQAAQPLPAQSVQSVGRSASDNTQMEFEAKSARDGAWYDVASFLSHRSVETGDPEVLVRFAGFGAEEDEWVNVRKHVRQRSLPCESSECVAVLPGDLILCFQEGKEQALYFDAHVLDAQRRRHDVRGCRCRFLVRYDHDQSEEIVPLRKVCRRPETDYRLQHLNAESVKQQKIVNDPMKVYPLAETTKRAQAESSIKPAELIQNQQPALEDTVKPGPNMAPTQLPKSSTDSLTGNTSAEATLKHKEDMTEKPVSEIAEVPQEEIGEIDRAERINEAPAETAEVPQAETEEMHSAETTNKALAEAEEVPQAEKREMPLAEAINKAPAETAEVPQSEEIDTPLEEAINKAPAETAEVARAEETEIPLSETINEASAETTLEHPADSSSKPAEAEEQPKTEGHVDAGAVAASADHVNAPL